MLITDLRKVHQAISRELTLTRGALRLSRPATRQRRISQRAQEMQAESPALRLLMRNEREAANVFGELARDDDQVYKPLVGVARHHMRGVRQQIREAKRTIAEARRDTTVSFPRVDLSDDATSLVAALMVEERLERAGVAQLLDVYRAGIQRQDLRGFLECTAIESMVRSTPYKATEQAELAIAKDLRELIATVEMLRLPPDLPDLDALESTIDVLDARGEALQIPAIHPDHEPQAAQLFAEREKELLEAGAADDATDQKRLANEAAAS